MLAFQTILLFLFSFWQMQPINIEPHVPAPLQSDEQQLKAELGRVEPKFTADGHRQFDLEVATVATWEGKRTLGMRLWLPATKKAGEAPYPLVAYVHGGAFAYGNHALELTENKGFASVIQHLLDAGMAVASLDYRLAGEAGWPAPIRDTKCGLRFLRTFADTLGINTNSIVVMGHSAGARITALLGLIEDDPWHTGELPWQNASAQVQAIHLFAGSAYTLPEAQTWWEYVRPTQFSVPRMLFGEHPEKQENTRKLLRIRHQAAHLAGKLPPLRMVRGRSDYGGNHTDAQTAIKVWQALGQKASLSVVEGGHNAKGNLDEVVYFCQKHLAGDAKGTITISPENTAMKLIAMGEVKAALSVLVQAYDPSCTKGEWLILTDEVKTLLWLPNTDHWPDTTAVTLLKAACAQISGEETARMVLGLVSGKPGQADIAAKNAARLGQGDLAEALSKKAKEEVDRRHKLLERMQQSAKLWVLGDSTAAVELLTDTQLQLEAAKKNLAASGYPKPDWAVRAGTDPYGKWAELALSPDVNMRFRFISAGEWTLPAYLQWQPAENKASITKLSIERDLWVAEREVTQAQWSSVMGDTWEGDPLAPNADQEYKEILDWLAQANQIKVGLFLRLPSEQEWLHAAMAGGREGAWGSIQAHRSAKTPIARGEELPNLAGVTGMLGGVQEWTATSGRGYAEVTLPNGKQAVWGYPIARGGGWGHPDQIVGPDVRTRQHPGNLQPDLGFRPVIDAGKPALQWLDWLEQR